jgi:hypothetical protein
MAEVLPAGAIRLAEAAVAFGMHVNTLYQAASTGRLPVIRVGRQVFALPAAVQAYREGWVRRVSNSQPCPECERVSPECGWALPYEGNCGEKVVLCRDCYHRLTD